MAASSITSVLIGSNFLGLSGRVGVSEPVSSEASSSNRVVDGPVRVRCMTSGSGQRSSREADSGSLSTSYFPGDSTTAPGSEEWWRTPQVPQGGRKSISFDMEVSPFASTSVGVNLQSDSSSIDWRDDPVWLEHPFEETPTSKGTSGGVPVFVMLPLDSVNWATNTVNRRRAMSASLLALKSAGVEGIMMDVWWGIVEKDGPQQYAWSAYRDLIEMARKAGLKVQAVMSFHQCGGNVGDSCTIPLPHWVVDEIKSNNDLVYTDKYGNRNFEYLSLGVDELPVLRGRSPVQVYSDFMRSFRDNFSDLLGETIIEIQVGMGPAGELRYPGYPEQNGRWRFPGIGEFQCYDKYMLANLKAHAASIGKASWGQGGPADAGDYNRWPNDVPFFKKDGGWSSEYGKFFLEWYSDMLLAHGERILSGAAGIFRGTGAVLSGKVAGIHWHYGTRSHAAELTAGYYNTRGRDGYLPIARMFGKHGVVFNFTCIEMKDEEQPGEASCSPEGLLRQVTEATRVAGVSLAGENALPRFDEAAYDQVVRNSRLQFQSIHRDYSTDCEPMSAFTFLRMSENLFQPENWGLFVAFVRHMQEGRTFQPWEQQHRETESHVYATGPLVHQASQALLRQ